MVLVDFLFGNDYNTKTNLVWDNGDRADKSIITSDGTEIFTDYVWVDGSRADKTFINPDGALIKINYTWADGDRVEKSITKPDGTVIMTNYTWADGDRVEKSITKPDGTQIHTNYTWADGRRAEKILNNNPDGTETFINYIDEFGKKYSKYVIDQNDAVLVSEPMKEEVKSIKTDNELIIKNKEKYFDYPQYFDYPPEVKAKIQLYEERLKNSKENMKEVKPIKTDSSSIIKNKDFVDYTKHPLYRIKTDSSSIIKNKVRYFNNADKKNMVEDYFNQFTNYIKSEIDDEVIIEKDPIENQEKNIIHGTIEICEFCQYYELKYDECEYDRDCEYQRRY